LDIILSTLLLLNKNNIKTSKTLPNLEYLAHNGFPFEQQSMKTSEGKISDKPWEHGNDMSGFLAKINSKI
jgi:hypothetical protein